MKEIKKILVANRGEIAIRVMKTAKKMGIKTVAVYSSADRNALHVKYADEAVLIGEATSSQSYLRGDKIIEVCKELGVDAVHPGYGFLSENSSFAEACEKNNIIFIGPKSKAIEMMGSKLAAKEAVKYYNIPMVPGTEDAITDIEAAKKIATEIGFPILIKASFDLICIFLYKFINVSLISYALIVPFTLILLFSLFCNNAINTLPPPRNNS